MEREFRTRIEPRFIESENGLVSVFPASGEVKELYVKCTGDANGRGKAREEENR